MLLRRRSPLFIEWQSDGPRIIAPADSKTRLKLGPEVLKVLEELSEPVPRDALLRKFASSAKVTQKIETLLDTLLTHGVVVAAVDDVAELTATPWDQWGSIARLYHEHSRNAPYITDTEAKRGYISRLTALDPPSATKSYLSAPTIYLPRARRTLTASIEDVLVIRRTHREFLGTSVSTADLSALLQLTFGPQVFADGLAFGTLQRRTSPNAGARQEIECYLAALNVQDVPTGLYHYNVIEHSLELLTHSIGREDISKILYGAPMADTAPLVCFTTAMTHRISYKYQHGRAYRLWMYNIGHVGQTFVLTATGLGMGAFQTAAFRDAEADLLLGVDGAAEFVTYILGCGMVADLARPADCIAPPPRPRI